MKLSNRITQTAALSLSAVAIVTGIGATLTYTINKFFPTREDTIKHEYTVTGENFSSEIGKLHNRYPTADREAANFYIHSESTWRNYPSAAKPLPRGEVREYTSGRMIVDLYFPRE